MNRGLCTVILAWLILAAAPGVRAVIFVSTADPAFNTTEPTGDLAGSGWQWQGNWRGFGGTPIAPQFFLTAKHVGGAVGDLFVLGAETHRAVASFADPASDLVLWKVCGTFESYAPLYDGAGETGQPCTVFGWGFGRGTAVAVTNGNSSVLKGWRWGGGNGTLRWGTNRIEQVRPASDGTAELLVARFDAEGGGVEATLAGGDSGSGLFVLDDGGWQLAGVNYAVDGPFNYSEAGASFNAALFDKGGLYELDDDYVWQSVPDRPGDRPGALYATRVASRRDWIESTLAAHSDPPEPPRLQAAPAVAGPYEDSPGVVHDRVRKTIAWSVPDHPEFYRLSDCQPRRIVSLVLDEGSLVLTYE